MILCSSISSRPSSPTTAPLLSTTTRVEPSTTSSSSDEMSTMPASLIGKLLDDRLHLRLGADVDSPCRLIEQQDLRFDAQHPGEQRLLLVATRQVGDVLPAAGRLDPEAGDEVADQPVDAAAGR